MHLSSTWRHPDIIPMPVSMLTPMGINRDGRWKTRDLPKVIESGLWYPIMIYKVTLDWWDNGYAVWRSKFNWYPTPVVNSDGFIWAVKMGTNRWMCANHLGYRSIDCMMFSHPDDCVKMSVWHRECDPLHNPDAEPYSGKWQYV